MMYMGYNHTCFKFLSYLKPGATLCILANLSDGASKTRRIFSPVYRLSDNDTLSLLRIHSYFNALHTSEKTGHKHGYLKSQDTGM